MAMYSYVKRRIYKTFPIFKKVVIPVSVIFIIIHVFSGSTVPKVDIEENMILPGEALDPLIEKVDESPVGRRTHEPYKAKQKPMTVEKQKEIRFEPPKQLSPEQVPVRNRFEEKEILLDNPGKLNHPPSVPEEISQMKTKPKAFDDSDVPPRIKTEWSMAKANIPDAHKVKFRGHAITNDTVTLTLMSSADKVFMSINKKEIYRSIGIRGMHVVVLNQYSGRVMAKRSFDTYLKGVEEDMVEFLDDITDGRIVVFAVLDEVATGLTWKGRNALKEFGCRFSEKIGYRDMWAMATRKNGLKMAETYSNVATADTGYEWGGPIFMRTDFDLEEEPVECKWPYNERNQARRQFCLRYEGYGSMCRCDVNQYKDVFFDVNQKLHDQLARNPLYSQLGVIILATNRPHVLYKTLKSLHEAPGLNKNMLAIYVEQATREVTGLAKLFGVTLVESGKFSNVTTTQRVRHKVQRVFRDVIGVSFKPDTIPEGGLPNDVLPPFSASKILILEEDIEVSIDIFKYLHSVSPILDLDQSVLGISAFNHNGFREVASSQTTFYRTSDAHGLALMLPSRTIKEILAPNWPSVKSSDEWWNEFYNVMFKNKRDLVYPEVSRAKHSSYEGFMIKGPVQLDNFRDHVLSMTTEYEISQQEVGNLQREVYEKRVEETIRSSKKIVFDFCKHELIYGQDPNVMFVTYDGKDDAHLRYVFKCLKTWSIYPTGSWRDVWQFHFHGHLLTIVGVPSSPYSKLKTAQDTAVTAPPEAFTTTTTPSPGVKSS